MPRYRNSSARIAPASGPLAADIQDSITAVMGGSDPLVLFTTLARDRRLFMKLFNSGLLDRGHLTIRQREIVIDRVTAQCGAEYEWGVHVAAYAAEAGLDERQIASLVAGDVSDVSSDEDRALIRFVTACTSAAPSMTTCGKPLGDITPTRRSSNCSCSLVITAW